MRRGGVCQLVGLAFSAMAPGCSLKYAQSCNYLDHATNPEPWKDEVIGISKTPDCDRSIE